MVCSYYTIVHCVSQQQPSENSCDAMFEFRYGEPSGYILCMQS